MDAQADLVLHCPHMPEDAWHGLNVRGNIIGLWILCCYFNQYFFTSCLYSGIARTELVLLAPRKYIRKTFYIVSLPKWGLLLKERICSLWEQILSFKSSPNDKGSKYISIGNLSLMQVFFPYAHI